MAALAFVTVAGAAFGASSRPALAGAVATESCANPELPRAILEGAPVAPGGAELRMIRVAAPKESLTLAVADTVKRRDLGLMCVTALRADAGMIFVFPKSDAWVFWMKNTLVPLDMLWLDAGGKVTTVAARVPASTLSEPEDKVARRSGSGRYVVELRAGDAARVGLRVGDRLELPELAAPE